MTSDIRVGRWVQDNPKVGRYRVRQGRQVGQKWTKTWNIINGRSLTRGLNHSFKGNKKIVYLVAHRIQQPIQKLLILSSIGLLLTKKTVKNNK